MKYELKDWLNSINHTKEDLTENDSDAIKKYPPFIVNRCLSGHIDTLLFANEMNIYHDLPKDMQYSFFINTVRKKKRFSPWIKKDKVEDLDCIKRYYGYSDTKALQALRILSTDQINYIRSKLDIGGLK
jgi:hypothetical protein